MVRLHQLSVERIAGRVEAGGAGGGDGERTSRDVADLTVELKTAKDSIGDAMGREGLTAAERQMVDDPELQVVGAIVAGGGAVHLEVRGVGECRSVRTGAGTIVLEVDGMGPGVDETELRKAAGVARQLRLQSVVFRAEQRLIHGDTAGVIAGVTGNGVAAGVDVHQLVGGEVAGTGQPSGRVIFPVRHADGRAAGQRGRVQRVAGRLSHLMGTHVADVHDKRVAEVLLDEEVPAFDIAAAEVLGHSVR